MMPPLLDFWFDFASTYSYPAAMQIAPLAQQAGVMVRFRPFLNLPFRQPEPFPQNSLLAARIALIGLSRSWGEQFCRSVFRAEFGEGRQIGDPTVIGDILSQLRIESAPVLEAVRAETIKAALRTQTGEAKQLGIFGAPSFTTADGELFWGNDRLERAIAWAKNRR
jgi:2-hydroxychromene-2-carboxylate isomerase